MAKLKMLKAPKKPKRSASLETKQKYLAKVNAIKAENKRRHSINQKSEQLDKVIAGIGSVTVRPSSFTAKVVRKRKSTHAAAAPKKRRKKAAVSGVKKRRKAAPRKAAKRTTKRRR